MNIIQKIKDTIAYLKELFSCPICDSEDIMLSLYCIKSKVINLSATRVSYEKTQNPGRILINWEMITASTGNKLTDPTVLSHINIDTEINYYPEREDKIVDYSTDKNVEYSSRQLDIDEFTVTRDNNHGIEIRTYGKFPGILEVVLTFNIECNATQYKHSRAAFYLGK